MDRILSYSKVDAFFNDLANKHIDIKDYVGTAEGELADKLQTVDGLGSPFLCFFNYRGALSGNDQRTFNNRTLSFVIAFAGIDHTDFVARKKAVDDAEVIGLEVLSRISVISKTPAVGWLYNNFDKASVNYLEFVMEEAEGLFGMEFHFNLKVLEPLIVTPEKWSDGDQFCT